MYKNIIIIIIISRSSSSSSNRESCRVAVVVVVEEEQQEEGGGFSPHWGLVLGLFESSVRQGTYGRKSNFSDLQNCERVTVHVKKAMCP